ncbi:LacI family DNA-binding transcriptional regulator [Mesobacillus subterraneus]|uniref:LacI family DNA-binding transcriptional regulator n=1 Tax=Mesobacillus subterraneus TaxID=285983 RepID=UPI001CFDED92|nr:LacI family DNA-binding transcriptional regulator [Mesobacillus subterraneus]WLR57026.1 LacI family DNA-binding transcriptional regulator [Mesobacillus subterraneus]
MSYTIKDVAKNANVSIATVSRVLNGQGGYSKATEEKVLLSIKVLGYQPNAFARGLISNKSNTVGIIFPEVSSQFSSKILRGVEEAAHRLNSSVIVCNTASHGQRTMKYLQLLTEKRVDGILFVSELITEEYYKKLESMEIPVVLISTESYQYSLPYIKVDDKHAAFTATDYLIKMGHSKIGMISGNRDDIIAGQPRIDGYKQALAQRGLDINSEHIIHSQGFSFKDGFIGLPKLLEQFPDLTAVFAASDSLALGAISSAYKLGIKIPDQLSIIGYDNLPIAEMAIPPLTTVAQPLEEMGLIAADMLFTMMNQGRKVESRIMSHTVIERESVKKLN